MAGFLRRYVAPMTSVLQAASTMSLVITDRPLISLTTHQFSHALHSGGGGIRRCRHI
jgi:hypothetical protein